MRFHVCIQSSYSTADCESTPMIRSWCPQPLSPCQRRPPPGEWRQGHGFGAWAVPLRQGARSPQTQTNASSWIPCGRCPTSSSQERQGQVSNSEKAARVGKLQTV